MTKGHLVLGVTLGSLLAGPSAGGECFQYAGTESSVISFVGHSGADIHFIVGQEPALVVRPDSDLDVDTFRAYLGGEDITERFFDNGVFREIFELPEVEGETILKVEAHFVSDRNGEQWRGCEAPPLRWRTWHVAAQYLEIKTDTSITVGGETAPGDMRFEESQGIRHLAPTGEM